MTERDQWRSAVIADMALGAIDILVAVIIDEHGTAPIGQEELARRCRCSVRTMQRAIRVLVARRHIIMAPAHGRAVSRYSRWFADDVPPPWWNDDAQSRQQFMNFWDAHQSDPRLAGLEFARSAKRGWI
jgi:hypothetical protein